MLVGQPVLPLLLLAAVSFAENQTVFYPIGSTITLNLAPLLSESINRILWKCNTDYVADWTHGQFLSYGRFKHRTTVDITTGRLEIRSGTTTDSGKYEVEVNDRLHDLVYAVMVIKRVPKPIVWIQPLKCSPSSSQCTLSCDGSTEGAEPITFSWTAGNGPWKQSGKQLPITNDTANVHTFSCRMENPVSHQDSDPKVNPFIQEDAPQTSIAIITVAIVICVSVVICIIAFCYKYQNKNRRGHSPVNQDPSAETSQQNNTVSVGLKSA